MNKKASAVALAVFKKMLDYLTIELLGYVPGSLPSVARLSYPETK